MPNLTRITAAAEGLTLTWDDGGVHQLPWRLLRDRCPCATCLAQATAPAAPATGLLPVLTLAETQPLKAIRLEPMGHYALGIHFSDGHATGIYAHELLRRLGEEAAKSQARP